MLLQEEKHFLFNGLFTSFNNVLPALFRKYCMEVAEKTPYLALEAKDCSSFWFVPCDAVYGYTVMAT